MAAELTALDPAIETKINELVNARVNEALKEQFASLTASRANGEPGETKSRKRLALVASKGSLDMAYPPLILATSAAAMDWEVGVFFTFYGLDILNRNKVGNLQVAPLGNPAMPAPIGNIAVPNLIGAIPGMTSIATSMMRGWMNRAKVPAVKPSCSTWLAIVASIFSPVPRQWALCGLRNKILSRESSSPARPRSWTTLPKRTFRFSFSDS